MRWWCLYGAHISMHKLGVLDVVTMFTRISTRLDFVGWYAFLLFTKEDDRLHFALLLFVSVSINFEHFPLNDFSFVRKHFRTFSAIIAYAIIIWSIRLHYYIIILGVLYMYVCCTHIPYFDELGQLFIVSRLGEEPTPTITEPRIK